MVKNITLGADPELFLEKNGEIISAEGMIGGTKHEPKSIGNKCFVQEDNIMIEFNIGASSTLDEFKDGISYTLEYLETMCKLYGKEYSLNFSASSEINEKHLRTMQSKTFGCEADYNVYLKSSNKPPNSSGTLRSCGGHIHIGYENPNQKTSEKIVYAMDMILGLQSITIDKDDRRKEMYGKAGCFRFKKYGVEYRTLSNFWIASEDLIEWAYESTHLALDLVNSDIIDSLIHTFGDAVKNSIDNNDKEMASSLLDNIFKAIEKNNIKNKELILK